VVVVVWGEDGAGARAGQLDDRAAVGRFEDRDVQRRLRRAGGDLAAVEAEHLVGAAGLLEVVGGDDDGAALVGQRPDQRFQALGAGAVEAGEGLVEEQDLGVLDEAAGDQDALALAA
jgi:hypothetical protein